MDQGTLFDGMELTKAAQKRPPKESLAIFVREWLKDENGARAAREAGLSAKTAASQASRLLADARVQRAIRHERGRLEMLTPDLSVERVLGELACAAFLDVGKLYDESGKLLEVHEMDEPTRRAIAGVEYVKGKLKVKMVEKRGAIEVIARIKGYMAPDKAEIDGALTLVMDV